MKVKKSFLALTLLAILIVISGYFLIFRDYFRFGVAILRCGHQPIVVAESFGPSVAHYPNTSDPFYGPGIFSNYYCNEAEVRMARLHLSK